MKIWIDAGHGGSASGAVGDMRMEKGDALNFAVELERQFEAQGCDTVMTRRTDVFVSMEARTKLERDNKCDLAISCHRNAAGPDARGFEVWIHHAPANSVVQWARDVAQEIKAAGMPLRSGTVAGKSGVYTGHRDDRNADYYCNSGTNSPSMLLELGFISNKADNALFDAKRGELCAAVVKASCKFLGIPYKATDAKPPVPDKPSVPGKPTPDYEALYAAEHDKLLEWQAKAEDWAARAQAAENKIMEIVALANGT